LQNFSLLYQFIQLFKLYQYALKYLIFIILSINFETALADLQIPQMNMIFYELTFYFIDLYLSLTR